MRNRDLLLRKTHTYVADCSHLDDWESIGVYRVLKNTCKEVDGYYAPDVVHTMTLKVISDKPDKVIREALYNMFDKGCSCEHDCCGHLHGGARRPVKTKRKEWFVYCNYGRNY